MRRFHIISTRSGVYAITARLRPKGLHQGFVEFGGGGADARVEYGGINRIDEFKGEFHVLGGYEIITIIFFR